MLNLLNTGDRPSSVVGCLQQLDTTALPRNVPRRGFCLASGCLHGKPLSKGLGEPEQTLLVTVRTWVTTYPMRPDRSSWVSPVQTSFVYLEWGELFKDGICIYP